MMILLFSFMLTALLPLAGALAAGRDLADLLSFRPLAVPAGHGPVNGLIFTAGICLALGTALFLIHRLAPAFSRPRPTGRMPWWGWCGLCTLLVFWLLSWTRFSWFQPVQLYTFTPLWLGYIFLVNGLTRRYQGECLLTGSPGFFCRLFLLSALFWWLFEWLNRFVHNWYYLGVDALSDRAFALHATLCFSTVLPAVASTRELLHVFFPPRARLCGTSGTTPAPLPGAILLTFAGLSLFLLPLYPNVFFPVIWIAPFLIIVAIQLITGRQSPYEFLENKLWPPVLVPALSGLTCGFFWELWNTHSLARWAYAIPWVDTAHLFAMPLLGYLGYLPFGLECAVCEDLAKGPRKKWRKKLHA